MSFSRPVSGQQSGGPPKPVNRYPPQELKLVIAGNSNARRTRDHYVPIKERKHGKKTLSVKPVDVSWSDPQRARDFSERLNISDIVKETYTVAQNGPGPRDKINFLQELIECRARLVNLDADIYYFCVLSNDLANMVSYDEGALLRLVHQLFELAESLPSAKLLLFQQVMPRYENLSGTPELFWKCAEYVNKKVKERCGKNRICAVAQMSGLLYMNTKKGPVPCPSKVGFEDGIHPKKDKYHQRIRMAICKNAKIVLGENKK